MKHALAENTTRFYTMNLEEHIEPVIGSKPLATLTRADCRAVLAACQEKKLRVASLLGICRTMSSVVTHAVEDGHLAANPAFASVATRGARTKQSTRSTR